MKEGSADERTGRFLSFVLRHHPEAIGLRLDEHGWADVKELIEGTNKAGYPMTERDLERIVLTNSKKRYSYNEDHTRIRANQGHSLKVDLDLSETLPPELLYHGTAGRFLESIKRDGITKQQRQHVHLSQDEKTAFSVGRRHGKPAVVLVIDAAKMAQDGIRFYRSENGVWLCEQVEWKYVREVRKGGV